MKDLKEFYEHSGGLNTREAAYLLQDNEFADCQNVTLEEQGKVKTRKGHVAYGSALPVASGLTVVSSCDTLTAGGVWTEYKELLANFNYPNTDMAALPTDGAAVCSFATQAAITAALGVLTIAAQPTIRSTICFCVKNDTGAPLNLFEGTTTIRVVGTLSGVVQTEDILITSTALNKAVADGKFRYMYGVKKFDTVTAITQPNFAADAMAATLKIAVGVGVATMYEGLGFIRDSVTMGIEIEDCDTDANWTGQDGVVATPVYEGLKSLEDSVTLGEVTDDCEATTNWTGCYLEAVHKEGTTSLHTGSEAIKTVTKDYSAYKDDARFRIWLYQVFPGMVSVRFYTNPVSFYRYDFTVSGSATWEQHTALKSDFTAHMTGAPDWSTITEIRVKVISGGPVNFDYMTWQEKGRDNVTVKYTAAMNLAFLEDDARFRFRFKRFSADWDSVTVRVRFYDGVKYFTNTLNPNPVNPGWQQLYCTKADFTQVGGPDWASIDDMRLAVTFNYSAYQVPGRVVDWNYDIIEFVEQNKEGSTVFTQAMNFSTLSDSAEFSFYANLPAGLSTAVFGIAFYDGVSYYTSPEMAADISNTGWQRLACTKGSFSVGSGAPNWNAIDYMVVYCTIGYSTWQAVATETVWGIDYFVWSEPTTTNRILGLYEYRKKDAVTVKEVACIGTEIYDLFDRATATHGGMLAGGYTFCTMNDYLIATNGLSVPHKATYNPATGLWTWSDVGASTWPNAAEDGPPLAKYCCIHKNRLWMAGLTAAGYESYVVFAEPGDPSALNQWPVNNYLIIGTDDGDIITGIIVLGDTLVIFKQYSTWVVMGASTYDFELMKIDAHHGCIAPKSISVGKEGVYYLAHDGVRVFNGNTSRVISEKIRGTFNETILKSAMGSAVGVYYNDTYQLWCVEEGGVSGELYPDLAIVYYEPLDAWTLWRPGRLGEASSGPFPNCFAVLGKELYMGLATSSQIAKCFTGNDDVGNPIYAYMTTKELNLGTPERHKFFHHLYAVTEAVPGAYSLTVECNTERTAENRAYSFPMQDLDDNLIENRKTITLQGRYLQATFSVEGHDQDGVAEPYGPFGLLGYRIGYTPQRVK